VLQLTTPFLNHMVIRQLKPITVYEIISDFFGYSVCDTDKSSLLEALMGLGYLHLEQFSEQKRPVK